MNFFDFLENQGKRKDEPPAKQPEAMSVSQLTGLIDRAIKSGVPGTVYVRGEISNVNHHRASGHLYFTMKDANACIDCVMFKTEATRLKFDPEDGAELLATGSVRVYAQRGRYQLYVTSLQPLGKGALELAFQQVRAKLEKEGLFDPQRRKPLPRYPRKIALITSRQTAALQDILKVFRPFPWLKVSVFHVPVQGEGAAEQIADALRILSRQSPKLGIDLILLARGGGSLEDLWEFNEEIVARAIAASKIPIITGVGHEVDVSIADLVADYHAHTPTEAAQVAVARWRVAREMLDTATLRIGRALRVALGDARHRLSGVEKHEFFRRPMDRINQLRQVLDDRQRSLMIASTARLRNSTSRLDRAAGKLAGLTPAHQVRLRREQLRSLSRQLIGTARRNLQKISGTINAHDDQLRALSPQAVLHRGYTITTDRKGKVLRDSASLREGDRIVTRFADGTVDSRVEDSRQMSLFE